MVMSREPPHDAFCVKAMGTLQDDGMVASVEGIKAHRAARTGGGLTKSNATQLQKLIK
jgi:hypothetical protein|tara:strand:- start:227 stop:400 length:174 start_codon:yes stop_codon:yes gene_type:complete